MISFRCVTGIAAAMHLACGLSLAHPAFAAIPRDQPASGSIVFANGDEELQPVGDTRWHTAEVAQDLVGGDTLRTGPFGGLALLFVDQTQLRVHRNSELEVRDVRPPEPAQVGLNSGRIWARAARGGRGVDVQTPAATAAIRGTDWSLAVDEDGRTTLIVLDGVVEFFNPFGSVTVRAGEAAVAAVGMAPTRILVADVRDREQMLFYLAVRDAFGWMPATDVPRREMREARRRLLARDETARTAEDWLSLAEIARIYDGRPAARSALERAVRAGLDPEGQTARARLLEALFAGSEDDYPLAIDLFGEAMPGLSGERLATAAYGRFFALRLAGMATEADLPDAGDHAGTVSAALARGWISASSGLMEEALLILEEAHGHGAEDVFVLAFLGAVALVLDRREVLAEAVERAQAIDPGDPHSLALAASRKFYIDWDVDGAVWDYRRAVAAAPGDTRLWNGLGLALYERGDYAEAEAAYRRAIDIDPYDPLLYANLAILMLDNYLLDEALAAVERVFELDPAFDAAWLGMGRYHLQRGETEAAREAFLAASAANPALSGGLLGLAVAHYQAGDLVRAHQALANADRLDPNNPLLPLVATVIAIDRAEADEAITQAREAHRRFRLRGGQADRLASTRAAGSYLSSAFATIDLAQWGRYYGDYLLNPFDSTSHFSDAVVARPSIFTPDLASDGTPAVSAVIQGLLLEPLAVSARSRFTDTYRRPFIDTNAGVGLTALGGRLDRRAFVVTQGFVNDSMPVSYFINAGADHRDGDRPHDEFASLVGGLFLGLMPTPVDRFLISANVASSGADLPGRIEAPAEDRLESTAAVLDVGYSRSFGARNMLLARLGVGRVGQDIEQAQRVDEFLIDSRLRIRERLLTAGLAHWIGHDRVTLRYGAELRLFDADAAAVSRLLLDETLLAEETGTEDQDGVTALAYADVLYELMPRFKLQGGVYLVNVEDGASVDRRRTDTRLGLAWEPRHGQWLRIAYREDTETQFLSTLAPVTTLGLVPSAAPLGTGGAARTLTGRWDAEWTPRLFSAVETERQRLTGIAFALPGTLESIGFAKGEVTRLSVYANAWLGRGVGAFAQGSLQWSDIRSDAPEAGMDLPFVPDWTALFGVTWLHPSQLRVSVVERLVGRRGGDASGTRLDSFAATDAAVSWEPLERRLRLAARLSNLFNADDDIAIGIPGPGRTLAADATWRF